MGDKMNYTEGKAIVFHAIDRLRIVGLIDFNVFFYILHLCRNKYFNITQSEFNQYNSVNIIDKILQNSDIDNRDLLIKILNIYNDDIQKIDSKSLYDVTFPLIQISDDWYIEHYVLLFEELLVDNFSTQIIGENIQPAEITKLIAKLSGYNNNGIVYNPFAGLASYGIEMDVLSGYFAQELNERTWAIGKLRLLTHNINSENYTCNDSVLCWEAKYHKNEKLKPVFDLIIATPPFGLYIQYKEFWIEPKHKCTLEDYLIARGIEGLSTKGKLIGVFTTGILFKGGTTEVERKYAIDNDYLEMVISLPTKLYFNTAIPTVLLVFNKNKDIPRQVKFVDGSTLFKMGGRVNILKYELLLSYIESNDINFVRSIPQNEIIKNEYNLSVPIYFQKQFDGVLLNNLGDVIFRKQINEPIVGKIVKIRDLQNDSLDFTLNTDKIEDTEIHNTVFQIDESCILLAIRWNSLKPTYFKYVGNPIYISSDIIAFKLREKSNIDLDYFIQSLYSELFLEQLRSLQLGTIVPSIRKDDLLKIKIPVPDLKQQKDVVFQARKKVIQAKELELFDLKKKFEQQTYEEFASLKHALGKPVPGINTAIEYIYEFLEKNEGKPISLNSIVSTRRDVTLNDKFNVVFDGLKLIQTVLIKGNNGLILEEYPLQSCKIVPFIREFRYSTERFSCHVIQEIRIDNIEISANFDLLAILLNDLFSNAEKHAFTDNNFDNNKVAIYMTINENNNLDVVFANNGKPFPNNFDLSKFIQKFSKTEDSTGAGIGGYDINRIIKYFNGTFLLKTENSFDEYNTKFCFTFPITNANDIDYEEL